MDEQTYKKIFRKLNSLNGLKEKIEFLDSVIEPIDGDMNGFNEKLIEIRNKLNNENNNCDSLK